MAMVIADAERLETHLLALSLFCLLHPEGIFVEARGFNERDDLARDETILSCLAKPLSPTEMDNGFSSY